MKKLFFFVISILLIPMAKFASACPEDEQYAKDLIEKVYDKKRVANETKHLEMINAYVKRNQQWSKDDYTIQFEYIDKNGAVAVYFVVYKHREIGVVGGRKSFVINIDQNKMKIDRTLAFQ